LKKTETLFVKTIIIPFALLMLGANGCLNGDKNNSNVDIEKFVDSTGVEWRVLTQDDKGNKLIITEYVYGVTEVIEDELTHNIIGVSYNSTDVYTFLGQSDVLKLALDDWFIVKLAPELKEIALPVENINNDVRTEPGANEVNSHDTFFDVAVFENESAGWTSAGTGIATADNTLFVLSISEVNKYKNYGTLNIEGVTTIWNERANDFFISAWWLRSPSYSTLAPMVCIRTDNSDKSWFISIRNANRPSGFRPALWVVSIDDI